MAKPKNQQPPEAIALYDALIATVPEIARKGATLPYTSVNGNMFTVLSKDGSAGLRLPAAEREAFLAKYGAGLSVQFGMVMKEYAAVPIDLLRRTTELTPYLHASFEYAKTLKPKPAAPKKK